MSEFYEQFNYLRYGGKMLNRPIAESMANKGMKIGITRIATKEDNDVTVYFKAFVTTFTETYASDWTTEEVYGRADPIPIFKNTRRKITLGFKVPATTTGEAYENLGKVQKLMQFLYPTYIQQAEDSVSQTISRSPLVRIKFMNLLRNINSVENKASPMTAATLMYENYDMNGEGLLGVITNVNVLHNIEQESGVIEKGNSTGFQAILPKVLEINLDFEPIHEHPLGWDLDGVFGKGTTYNSKDRAAATTANGETFPYGVTLVDESAMAREISEAASQAATNITEGLDEADNLVAESVESSPESANEEADTSPGSVEAMLDGLIADAMSIVVEATVGLLVNPGIDSGPAATDASLSPTPQTDPSGPTRQQSWANRYRTADAWVGGILPGGPTTDTVKTYPKGWRWNGKGDK